MRMWIPICKLFSDPHMYAYGDPRVCKVIPVWENLHMGMLDLMSHMKISPICIWLVVELSPYAYAECHMHMGIPCFGNPRIHMGGDLDHRMHTGIMCIAIPLGKWESLSSPYTYVDPRTHNPNASDVF
jgi:hypothetical protein